MMLRFVPASLLVAGIVGSTVMAQPSLAASAAGAKPAPAGLPSAGQTTGGAQATGLTKTVDGVNAGFTLGGQVSLDPASRTPRQAYPKKATDALALPVHKKTGELTFTGRILVKLRDDLGARASKAAPAPRLMSIGGPAEAAALGDFEAVLNQFGGSAQAFITGHSDEAIRALELKAEARSGRGQPDLASIMAITVQPGQELAAARALNDLDIVEFVSFERRAATAIPTVSTAIPTRSAWRFR
jgi:hypothetical protein